MWTLSTSTRARLRIEEICRGLKVFPQIVGLEFDPRAYGNLLLTIGVGVSCCVKIVFCFGSRHESPCWLIDMGEAVLSSYNWQLSIPPPVDQVTEVARQHAHYVALAASRGVD